ncbi:MAG TPA: thioredoxin family protein [Ideonella sp.]|uniref:thioredoxin family protein n=1 Tax=Ideonella sp. TaxID=1929293 RepID=UPI002E30969C|nr:thioredoxin family protein [Ideonella sp.]HEX5684133.1 thioredoxin family protein [Ideonella sp.]
MLIKRRLLLLAMALATTLATAATGPYDESADAHKDVQRAFETAAKSQRPVLVIFGANWCGDCRALDTALKSQANADLIAKEFVVVKVDVGNFNRHLDIAERYGNAIKKGIPAAAVVSPKQELLYTTRGGELANARKMSDAGVYEFFRDVVATAAKAGK